MAASRVCVWTALASVLLAACERPAHVLLTIEDPDDIASEAVAVRIGSELGFGSTLSLDGRSFPASVVAAFPESAVETSTQTLWVEALDASSVVVGRGKSVVMPSRNGGRTGHVELKRPCDASADCDDDVFCNGASECKDHMCQPLREACAASLFPCVHLSCEEALKRCAPTLDHGACAPTAEGESTYCSVSYGCIPGKACNVDAECSDEAVCNGAEECSEGRCRPGIPPASDDGDVCTIDACVEPEGIIHIGDTAVDGRLCAREDGSNGICVTGICRRSGCGDGFIDSRTENCEDENDNANDGCDRCRETEWIPVVVTGLGFSGGRPLETSLAFPRGIAFDRNGNLYTVDSGNHRILRKDRATGTVTRIAGTGSRGFSGDGGPATLARLSSPESVAVDGKGQVFVTDRGNNRVRRIDDHGIIDTIAGNDSTDLSPDGLLASGASILDPVGIAIGARGEVFFSEAGHDRVLRIDIDGRLWTAAGTGVPGFSGDGGLGIRAALRTPGALAVDANALYIADTANFRVRRLDSRGVITTVAGSGRDDVSGDGGPATLAAIGQPFGIAFDSFGRLSLTDFRNHRIRQIAENGIISTLAGTGEARVAIDGTVARSAPIRGPLGIAFGVDGALHFSETGGGQIRALDTTGRLETILGSSVRSIDPTFDTPGRVRLDGPLALWVDADDVFVSDTFGSRILRLAQSDGGEVIAGIGAPGTSGVGGPALEAGLWGPAGLARAPDGSLLVGLHGAVGRIANDGTYTLVAGTGERGIAPGGGAALETPISEAAGVLAPAPGVVFFSESSAHRIRMVRDGILSTVVGTGVPGFSGDGGLAAQAQLRFPTGLGLDRAGNVLIADTGNHRIRRVEPNGRITTIAGTNQPGFAGDGGPAVLARLALPAAVTAASDGSIVVADSGNHVIRVISPMGSIRTVAGIGQRPGLAGDFGPAVEANLNVPTFAQFDGTGRLYIADSGNDRIRRVGADGIIETVLGETLPPDLGAFARGQLSAPRAMAWIPSLETHLFAGGPTGYVLGADMQQGAVDLVMGHPGGRVIPARGGGGIVARQSLLLDDAAGIAFDPSTSRAYISETDGDRILELSLVDARDLATWTVRGWLDREGGGPGSGPMHRDGPLANARVEGPTGLTLDDAARTLYIADTGNHVIRAIDLATEVSRTVAGVPTTRGFFGERIDASEALFDSPMAVALGNDHALYVADTENHRVRRIDPASGQIDTVVGDGTPSSSGAGAPARSFPVDRPRGMAVDAFGNLFIASRNSVRLVVSDEDGVASGESRVSTVYGESPRDRFPMSITTCLSDVAVIADDTVRITDECQGFLIELRRQERPLP